MKYGARPRGTRKHPHRDKDDVPILKNIISFVVVVADAVVANLLFNRRCTFKQNLYTVCDLALGLLVNKVTLFVLCTGKSSLVSLYA